MVSRHKHKKDLSTPAPGGRTVALICVVLAIVTLAAYWPVLGADFVNFDDIQYVTENRHVLNGLTLDGVKWAFSMDGYAANWHPLTWLSHMLDCELFDQNAGLHHLTNLIIHTTSTVVLLWVLVSMTGRVWPSAFVAAAFALHPLHVESVAWIAERKDVLSGLFWFLTMACYLRYTRTGGKGSYILALVVFGLGLMAKPMLVTLPFVLLLLDYWPLKRLEFVPAVSPLRTMRSLAIEKIPFFVLSVASCVVTFGAQRAGGAVVSTISIPFGDRLSNAMVSYMTYVVKTVWPVGLAVFYPLKHIPLWQSALALLVLAAITVAAVFWVRRKRYFLVGWLWYIGTLVPVMGLVQVGSQSHADRYTYIPLTGLFIIVAWAVGDFCRRRPTYRFVSGVTAMLLLAGMFSGTRNQVRYWEDSISLCRRAIEVTENNSNMHTNLGNALSKAGQLDEAIDHYRCALQIEPDDAKAHSNLGSALIKKGQMDKAIRHFRLALQVDPDLAEAHSNLGFALSEGGHLDEAINHHRRALKLRPEAPSAINNLAWFLAAASEPMLRNPVEAVRLAEKACELTGYENAATLDTLAVAYASADRFDEAVSTARKALGLAETAGNENLVREIRGHLKLFKEGQSYIEKPVVADGTPEK